MPPQSHSLLRNSAWESVGAVSADKGNASTEGWRDFVNSKLESMVACSKGTMCLMPLDLAFLQDSEAPKLDLDKNAPSRRQGARGRPCRQCRPGRCADCRFASAAAAVSQLPGQRSDEMHKLRTWSVLCVWHMQKPSSSASSTPPASPSCSFPCCSSSGSSWGGSWPSA